MQTSHQNKGFTLIELLVVIAVIAVLASVVLLALNSARTKARDVRRAADVRQFIISLEIYYQYNNTYPAALTDLAGAPTYIVNLPAAPTPLDGTCTAAENTYTYTQIGGGKDYTLTFCVGAKTGDLLPGSHTASSAGIN